jgi:hypothetical protein
VAILLIILVFLREQKEPHEIQSSKIEVANTDISAKQNTTETNRVMRKTNYANNTSSILQTKPITQEVKLRTLTDDKNVAIDFYGSVIDQDGNPLGDVRITGKTRTWYITDRAGIDSRFPKLSAMTDSTGKFEIHNASGDVLSIGSLEKAGYESELNSEREFGYHTAEQFSSDPNNPVIFRMWKRNIHEQLITGEKRFRIETDGQAYFVNLTKGTISQSDEEGDLKVWIKFPAEINTEQTNNWIAELDVVNGGISEEEDPYSSMYLAPKSNYIQTFQISRQLVRKNQRGMSGQHRFYIALKNGQEYGRITVDLVAPYNDKIPGLIEIQYAINPTGSRILR